MLDSAAGGENTFGRTEPARWHFMVGNGLSTFESRTSLWMLPDPLRASSSLILKVEVILQLS